MMQRKGYGVGGEVKVARVLQKGDAKKQSKRKEANLQAQPGIRSLSAALKWLPSALEGSPTPGLE